MSALERDEQLVIQLMGSVILRKGNHVFVVNPKEMALFVYLALTGLPQSREHLAELFWPERTQEQSLKNLRVLLSRLRKVLGTYLIITRITVAFDKDATHCIDVHDLLAGLAGGAGEMGRGDLDQASRKRFHDALKLYRGSLLCDLQTKTSSAFENWLDMQRIDVQMRVIRARRLLIEDALIHGDYVQGLRHSQALLCEDALEEQHHRYHMQLLVLSGQQRLALDHFESCRAFLQKETGREPEKETIRLLAQIQSGELAAAHKGKPQRRTKLEDNLQILLDKVARFWIEEVHLDMLGGQEPLNLEKTKRPDLLDRSWSAYLGVKEAPEQERITLEEGLGGLLKQVGPSLLITGDTGAGKTFTLLALLQQAIDRVKQDPNHPVPVVFHLGSWSLVDTDLQQWMTKELNLRYQIPRAMATKWLEAHRLFPLLDGLDEMRTDGLSPCIQAINTFRLTSGLSPMVVCTREAPYVAQQQRFHFDAALSLEPLDREQVLATLNGTEYLANAPLLKLARTPLFLNMLQGLGLTSRQSMVQTDVALLPQQLESVFVERLLQRRAARSPLPMDQVRTSLRWLASRSLKHHAVMFDPNEWQPLWLTRWQRVFYLIFSRMLCGLAIGVLLACFSLQLNGEPQLYTTLPLIGLLTGLTMAGLDGLVMGFVGFQHRWGLPLRILRFLITAVLSGCTAAVLHRVLIYPQNMRFTLVLFALLFALMFGHYTPQRLLHRDMARADGFGWSGRKGLKAGIVGSLVAMFITFVLLGTVGIFLSEGHGIRNVFPVIGISSFMYGFLFFGFRTRMIPQQQPFGVWCNLRRGAWLGLLSFCCILPTFVLLRYVMSQMGLPILIPNRLSLADPASVGLYAALLVATLVFFRFGVFVLIKHVVLRAVLHISGCLPWNPPLFLDFVVQCGLLHRTGSCYLFTHRTFMESLAAQPAPDEANAIPSHVQQLAT